MRTLLLLALVLVLGISAMVAGQPHNHGWFVAGTRHLHYADNAGKVTSAQFSSSSIYGATMNWDNRTALAFDYISKSILTIDPQKLAVVGTFFSHPNLSSASSVWDMAFDSNGDLFFSSTSPLKGVFKVTPGATTYSTVLGIGSSGAANMSIDPVSGELLVTRGSTAQTVVFQVSRDGSTIVTMGTGFYTRYGTYRHPLTGDIFSGSCCTNGGGSNGSILYLRNGTKVATIFLASTTIRGGYAPQPERASAANPSLVVAVWRDTSVSAADGIWRVDLGTKAISKLGTMSTGNCYKPVAVFGRNVQCIRTATGKWAARLSFPGHAGKNYGMVFGFSGTQGAVRLPDGRYVPLFPDDLFRLSLTASLAPFVTGNIGSLSTTAEGGATIDMTLLGKGANGLIIYMAAFVIDPKAPLGVAEISDPETLVVEGL